MKSQILTYIIFRTSHSLVILPSSVVLSKLKGNITWLLLLLLLNLCLLCLPIEAIPFLVFLCMIIFYQHWASTCACRKLFIHGDRRQRSNRDPEYPDSGWECCAGSGDKHLHDLSKIVYVCDNTNQGIQGLTSILKLFFWCFSFAGQNITSFGCVGRVRSQLDRVICG